MSTVRHRVRALGLVACVVVASLAVARPAAGQGADMLPDPISSRELSVYAKRLELTTVQRQVLSGAHDQYRREYAALRDGAIADFLEQMTQMQREARMPTLEQADKILKSWQDLLDRVKAVDEGFFARLDPMLDDEQRMMLPRLRLLRERERYKAAGVGNFTGRTPVDVSDMFVTLELPDEVRAQVDPAVMAYEQNLTRRLRKLSEMSASMMRDMLAAMEEMGYADMTAEEMSDPETMRRIQEDSARIFETITRRANEAVAEINELNHKTFTQIAAQLPEEPARAFRLRYYRRAYPRLSMILGAEREDWLAKATEREDLTDEQRRDIAALVDGYRREIEQLCQEAIKLIDEHRKDRSPFSMDAEAMQAHNEALQELGQEAAEFAARTHAAIEGIAPTESIDREAMEAAGIDPETLAAGVHAAGAVVVDIDGVKRTIHDQWIPSPISARDLREYAETLGLDDGASGAAKSLREMYVDELTKSPEVIEMIRAVTNLWTMDATTGQSKPPTAEAIDRCYELRRQARGAIAALDESFFENLAPLVSGDKADAVDRLRLRRMRDAYRSRLGLNVYGLGRDNEGSIDLVDFFGEADLPLDLLTRIESMLSAYEAASLPAMRATFQAAMNYHQASEKHSARTQWGQQKDAADQMAIWQEYQKTMQPLAKAMQDADEQLATLNRQTFAAICELLPGERRTAVERQFKRQAYPSVYTDPVAVADHLDRAQGLEGLPPEALQELTSLAASYRADYERLSEQMIDLSGQPNVMFMNHEDVDWQAYMERQQTLNKIKFERDDLSFRAIYRLQTLLTGKQIEQLGGLPEPPEKPARNW